MPAWIAPFSVATYKQRRKLLLTELAKQHDEFTAVFWSGSELIRNNDGHFPFRANSDFLYLTGFSEPETLILLQVKKGKIRSSIGVRPRDLSRNRGSEIWEGERIGVERAPDSLGFDDAFDIHDVEKVLRNWLAASHTLYWGLGIFSEWDQRLLQLITHLPSMQYYPRIQNLLDPRPVLHEMRKSKTSEEISFMREAAQIASLGHIRAMKTTRPGQYEYQVAAEVEREFKRNGAHAPAYNSIVAGGKNACTLHYSSNRAPLKDGDLLLIDAGAEYYGYASDITRCYPVSGRFSKEQREVYEWVLKSQMAAISAVRPKVKFLSPHKAALRVLIEGLRSMGILNKKTTSQILKERLYAPYFPHGTSHWLGLDTHDCGCARIDDSLTEYVDLAEGNVLTVEPGLYFRLDDKSVPARFRGIGVRIEDDILVTKAGYENLSAACPKKVEEIEALCVPKL